MSIYILLCTQFSKSSVYFSYVEHVTAWSSHTSSTSQPYVWLHIDSTAQAFPLSCQVVYSFPLSVYTQLFPFCIYPYT